MLINETDLKNFQSLKNVITKGKFEINGEAIVPVALLINWYNSLGERMVKSLEKPAIPVEKKEPIKKIGK
jgi:hypothetical protein